MKTAPLLTRPTPRRWPTRPRADIAPGLPAARLDVLSRAAHDFLVPLPRPDLALDVQTLRMIETR